MVATPINEGAFNKTVRQNFGLEIVKRVVGISIRLRKLNDGTLWRGRHIVRAGDVGAPADLGSLPPPIE
jgi:hypothetical protein